MSSRDTIQRSVLPIPDPQHVGLTTYDAKDPDTAFPPIEPLRPPEGAPNVLIVLIDDCGFGASSAYGGVAYTPQWVTGGRGGPPTPRSFDGLSAEWLRYTRFHTTALSPPTRAALPSGRNHHTVGMG